MLSVCFGKKKKLFCIRNKRLLIKSKLVFTFKWIQTHLNYFQIIFSGLKIRKACPHRCWGVSTDDKYEPLAPASGDLRRNNRERGMSELLLNLGYKYVISIL